MTRAVANPFEPTERQWQVQVVDLARKLGYFCYWTWNSLHSPKGWVDLVLVDPLRHRVIFAELKRDKGIVRPEQTQCLEALQACGMEVFVWRPSDAQTVAEILQASERP